MSELFQRVFKIFFIMCYWKAIFVCCFLAVFQKKFTVEAISISNIKNDLYEYNLMCPQDSCENNRSDSFLSRNCHCGIHCIDFGTCCFDSFYANVPQTKLKYACRSVYNGEPYFMIDHCYSNESAWADLCNNEWNDEDDVLKIVPVTSLSTNITYKNYYCFRCHEENDKFIFWNVKITSYSARNTQNESEYLDRKDEHLFLTFDKEEGTWMGFHDENSTHFPVDLSLNIPDEIQKITHVCERNIISDCSSEQAAEEVRNKCLSYMAMKKKRINFGRRRILRYYKNIHCALCNSENVDSFSCKEIDGDSSYGHRPSYGGHGFRPSNGGGHRPRPSGFKPNKPPLVMGGESDRKPFSFFYILDINRSDGELVGKTKKCADGSVWDPYSKKCRKLTCMLPGHKIENWKCVPA